MGGGSSIAKTFWRDYVKAAVANKQIQSRDHIAATIGKAFESGEITSVTPYSYTRVTTRRVGKKEAGEIKAKIGKGEHFCYKEAQFNERVKIPTAEDLGGGRGMQYFPRKSEPICRTSLQAPIFRTSFWQTCRPHCWQ